MQDNTESRTNPKDRNFDQEKESGKSKSTDGKEQQEEKVQDDYNAQDRNFDQGEVSGKPTANGHEPSDEKTDAEPAAPNRNIDPSVRQGPGEQPHK
ncbi:hypothetical protein [Polluticoccus soli]|uniref:hypothetical protein n=1 Tax=Polluticoccus soli TaxID=3034150 RepID=UPI0023E1B896|nr:hypothetical protein [Flavipsychrobacter sp. JY13-12]